MASLASVASLGAPISVFAEEKDIPINITVEPTSINVAIPTSIELANAGDTVDVTVASTNKIINNANTGTVYIDSINLEILNGWSLGDKTAKYEEMAKDSKNLYLGMKFSDEADFTNLKESYIPANNKIKAKSEKGLLFEGKTNIASSKLVSQVGNLVVTVSESDNVVRNGNLKKDFMESPYMKGIRELSFVTTQDEINSDMSWDASVEGDSSVMAWVDKNDNTKAFVGARNGKVIAPEDSSWLLYADSVAAAQMIDVTNLDVSNVKDMSNMLSHLGVGDTFELKGLDTWDVSNVVNMNSMFYGLGGNVVNFKLKGLENWDVSNVTNMSSMFCNTGATVAHTESMASLDIGDLSNWDVSNVTNMYGMFMGAGQYVTTFNMGDISKWNVSNVTNMSSMFMLTGQNATTFDIGDLSKWDISNVTNMYRMFEYAGNKATTFHIGDLEGWNVSHRLDNVKKVMIFNETGVAASFTPPSWYNPKEVDPYQK